MSTASDDIKALADQIYDLTVKLDLTGDAKYAEREADAYERLMNKREPMVQALARLLGEAPESGKETDNETWQAINQTLSALSELDRKHLDTVRQIMDSLKDSMKGLKESQKLTSHYMLSDDANVSLLDTKK